MLKIEVQKFNILTVNVLSDYTNPFVEVRTYTF